jgi:hybrid cluster-associated redox disulfide protein
MKTTSRRAAVPAITPDLLVDDVMRRWPATMRVFLDFRFLCVGCPIGCFHTVEDACREHHADLSAFLDALKIAAAAVETVDVAVAG